MTRSMAIGLLTMITLLGCSSGEPRQEPAPAAHDHGSHDHGSHDHSHGTPPPGGGDHHAAVAIEHDPICGMKATPSWTLFAMEAGQRFPFCSASCKAKFEQDPHRIGQAFFDESCGCKTAMPDCDCGHCTGKFEPCPCG